ncbi:MAG: hypothetical protein WDO18_16870 [Acidobacteriota bacterium]
MRTCFWTRTSFLSAVLASPEFQHKMTGTELRYRLGEFYSRQEKATGVSRGLLAAWLRHGDPDFCGRSGGWQRVPEFR